MDPLTTDLLYTEKELADWLRLSLPQLQRGRAEGSGPKFVQLSKRRIAYRKSDVEGWLAARTISRIGEFTGTLAGSPGSGGE